MGRHEGVPVCSFEPEKVEISQDKENNLILKIGEIIRSQISFEI